MSLNGSGVAVINSAGQPVVATTLITAVAFNALTADLATMISTAIFKDGQQTITQNIPFNDKKITGLGAGSARTDGASLATIQDGTGVYTATVGGTADVITLTPSPAITAYAAGQTFRFIASGANTTNVTVAVSGLVAKAITKNGTTALIAGDIPTNSMVAITYDGTRFILGTLGAATHITPADNVFRVTGSSDATKKLAFQVDGLTTATTRTITIPDRDTSIGPDLQVILATTSGTSVDLTSIPAGVRRVTLTLVGVSTNGTNDVWIQLGDAGGFEATGYLSTTTIINSTAVATSRLTTAFKLSDPSISGAGALFNGTVVLELHSASAFTWVCRAGITESAADIQYLTNGTKSLSAELTQVRLTTSTGANTFDAGAIAISYE